MSKLHDAFGRLFDTQKVGKGVKKGIDLPKNFINFFKYASIHFSDIFKINMLLVLGNFPFVFGLYALTGNLNHKVSSAASPLFGPLYGVMTNADGKVTPSFMALFGVHGVQDTASSMTTATIVMLALTALIMFTIGPVTTGATYLFRNLIKGEPIFFFPDLKYVIKKNFGQCMIIGILDCVITALLFYNITLSYFNFGAYVTNLVFYGNIALAILFILMRPYIYITLVTFKLNVFKIYKNAFIFAIIGAGRNIPMLVSIVIVVAVNYALLISFMPLGLCLPLFITIGLIWYISIYWAYPKIKEIMIDPYYDEIKVEADPDEQIFHDDVK